MVRHSDVPSSKFGHEIYPNILIIWRDVKSPNCDVIWRCLLWYQCQKTHTISYRSLRIFLRFLKYAHPCTKTLKQPSWNNLFIAENWNGAERRRLYNRLNELKNYSLINWCSLLSKFKMKELSGVSTAIKVSLSGNGLLKKIVAVPPNCLDRCENDEFKILRLKFI